MKQILLPLALFGAFVAAADPSVSVTSVVQDPLTKVVTVSYSLSGAPAIVTMTVETDSSDWTAIPGSALRHTCGDAFGIIRADSDALSITWHPEESWPDKAFASGEARVVLKAWKLDDPPEYAVFNLAVSNDVCFYESEAQLPRKVTDGLYKTDFLVMRRIPAANVVWRMGAAPDESGAVATREIPHNVTITKDYYMGVFELTQAQFARIYESSYESYSSFYKNRPHAPAVGLKWCDLRGSGSDYSFPRKKHDVATDSWIGKLRARTGQDFDLPTDAQWEYAARAGVGAAFQNGATSYSDESVLGLSWYYENSLENLREVGLCPANNWGLYDVHGNCAEWCLDWMSYDISSYVTDPEGPLDSPEGVQYVTGCRVIRGGSVSEHTANARFARRGWDNPDTAKLSYYGARLCLPAELK